MFLILLFLTFLDIYLCIFCKIKKNLLRLLQYLLGEVNPFTFNGMTDRLGLVLVPFHFVFLIYSAFLYSFSLFLPFFGLIGFSLSWFFFLKAMFSVTWALPALLSFWVGLSFGGGTLPWIVGHLAFLALDTKSQVDSCSSLRQLRNVPFPLFPMESHLLSIQIMNFCSLVITYISKIYLSSHLALTM